MPIKHITPYKKSNIVLFLAKGGASFSIAKLPLNADNARFSGVGHRNNSLYFEPTRFDLQEWPRWNPISTPNTTKSPSRALAAMRLKPTRLWKKRCTSKFVPPATRFTPASKRSSILRVVLKNSTKNTVRCTKQQLRPKWLGETLRGSAKSKKAAARLLFYLAASCWAIKSEN